MFYLYYYLDFICLIIWKKSSQRSFQGNEKSTCISLTGFVLVLSKFIFLSDVEIGSISNKRGDSFPDLFCWNQFDSFWTVLSHCDYKMNQENHCYILKLESWGIFTRSVSKSLHHLVFKKVSVNNCHAIQHESYI